MESKFLHKVKPANLPEILHNTNVPSPSACCSSIVLRYTLRRPLSNLAPTERPHQRDWAGNDEAHGERIKETLNDLTIPKAEVLDCFGIPLELLTGFAMLAVHPRTIATRLTGALTECRNSHSPLDPKEIPKTKNRFNVDLQGQLAWALARRFWGKDYQRRRPRSSIA